MDQILPLLAAFGLGSVLTALVQSALTNRTKRFDRIFAEKHTAYVGFLEARHRSAVEKTKDAARNAAYWRARCDLVGSGPVRKAIKGRLVDEELRRAMRDDLKISD